MLQHSAPIGTQMVRSVIPFRVGPDARRFRDGWRSLAAVRPRVGRRGFQRLRIGAGRLVLPQPAVVVAVGRGFGVGRQIQAHPHLAKVVGQHGAHATQCGGVGPALRGHHLAHAVARLVHPRVRVHPAFVPQRAAHAGQQVGKAQAFGAVLLNAAQEPASHARQALGQQVLHARILQAADDDLADGPEPCRRLVRRGEHAVRRGMGHGGEAVVGV